MPLVKCIHINDTCQLALWNISEELDDLLKDVSLSDAEQVKMNGFGSLSRKKEYVITRVLLKILLGEGIFIENDEHGKPSLINSSFDISISHSKGYVGVLVGRDYDLALDIEYLSDRVFRVAKKFMSHDELNAISESDKQLHIYQHWCAKECLIKLYGKKDVLLIDELKIHPFLPSQSMFSGEVCRVDFSRKYDFRFQTFDSYLMVWCCQRRD